MANNKLGFRSVFFLGVNTVIGSGIFLLPGKVHLLAGGWSLWLYFVITLVILSIAWSTAQCAALFQRNGGAYLYAREAFGEFVGFKVGVMRWFVGMISWATLAVGLITALGTISSIELQSSSYYLLLAALIGGLALLNWVGIKTLNGISQLIAIVKILPLLLFIAFGLFAINSLKFYDALILPMDETTFGEGALAVFYAFGGFEGLTVAAGEMKNPKRDLPIVLFLVISVCAFIYFSIQMVAMGTLGAALPESITPVSDVAEALFGNVGKLFVIGAMLLSMSGINLAASFLTPRTAAALADDNLLPPLLSKQGTFGTPGVAILITAIITLLIACSGSFTELVTICAVARFVSYTAICAATLVFQKRSGVRYLLQPWKLLLPIIGLVGIAFMLFLAPPNLLLWLAGALLLTIPLYLLRKWQTKLPLPSS